MALTQSTSFNISNKNIELRVENMNPIMSIGSLSSILSQKASHIIHINQSELHKNRRKLSLSSLSSSSNMTVMMSVTRASLYSNSTIPSINNKIEDKINNNPLRLQLNCSQQQNISVLLTLTNYDNRDYNTINPLILTFSTKCSNRNETFNYICSYPDKSR